MTEGLLKTLTSFLESVQCTSTNGTYDWGLQYCNPKERIEACEEKGKIFSPDADSTFFPDQCMTKDEYDRHLVNYSLSRESRVCEKEGDVMVGRRCISKEERRCLQSPDKVWTNDICHDKVQESIDWNDLFQ